MTNKYCWLINTIGRMKRQPKDNITNENSYFHLELEFVYILTFQIQLAKALALYHTDG